MRLHRGRARWRSVLLATAAALLGSVSARAETEPSAPPSPVDANEPVTIELEGERARAAALQMLMAAGRWEEAHAVFMTIPEELRAHPSLRFAEADILRHLGQQRRAADIYQRLLADDDSLVRVRLALADTYAEIGDERAAEVNYRLALAGDLPPPVSAHVQQRLATLDSRRTWRFSLGAAIAPDSNINQATHAETVDLFGLPFDLTDDARQQSGLNISAHGGLERIVRLDDDARIRLAAYARYSDNPGTAYDDGAIVLSAGPEWRWNGFDLAARATAERRWFGGDVYSESQGAQVEVAHAFDARTRLETTFTGVSYDEVLNDARDGTIWGLDLIRTHYLSPASLWRLSLSARRGDAESASESYWLERVSVGYYRTLPLWALALYVEPALLARQHDRAQAAFGDVREDTQAELSLRLMKRDWSAYGFVPFVGAQATHNESTIDLYSYRRERFELGFTRTF